MKRLSPIEAQVIATVYGSSLPPGVTLNTFEQGATIELVEHNKTLQKHICESDEVLIAAAGIALDHLREYPQYYEKLKKLRL